MVGRILDRHSDVMTFPELHFFEQMCDPRALSKEADRAHAENLMDRLLGVYSEGFLHYRGGGRYAEKAREILVKLDGERTPTNIFELFLATCAGEKGAAVACDQTPRNVLYVDEILRSYPTARVICMVRDPRAVLLSQKKKWKRRFLGASSIPLMESLRSFLNYHPYTISKLWVASTRAASLHAEHPRVLVLRYEDIVNQPESALMQLCRHLELSYDNGMLDVPYVGSSSGHDDLNRSRGLTTDSVRASFRGLLNAGEIYICEKVAGSLMQKYGYSVEMAGRAPLAWVGYYALIFPLKMSLSLFLNLRRMKNIRQSLARRLAPL